MKISVQRSRKLCLVLILLLFVTSSKALAQDQPVVNPETVGLSSERLERIGKTVQKDIDDKRIAGAVSLVIRHGQVAWFRAQGMSDREAGKPMRTDSILHSVSASTGLSHLSKNAHKNKPYTYLILPSSKESKQDIVQGLESVDQTLRRRRAKSQAAGRPAHSASLWNRGVIVELLSREVHSSRRERN